MALLVDTDVVSFTFKNDTRADIYKPYLDGHMLAISFMTLAELERWILIAKWGERRQRELKRYLRRYQIQRATNELCQKWAQVVEVVRENGRIISSSDGWIAATALLLGVPLVTHNKSDFIGIDGLTVISES
jgi:tRNA(fMet)-specific endonuclease VapC